MSYLKLGIKDNAVGNLSGGISASTTTISLGSGYGTKFPTGQQFVGTLVQYNIPADPTSGIAKSEKVLVTLRSTDTLTVIRGYDGSIATTFLNGDYFYLNVTSKIISDIQDEVTRLETDKLNKNAQLRTGNGAWKLSYNNGSGNETEIGLGTAGQVLSSNGASSAPEFKDPTGSMTGEVRLWTTNTPPTGWLISDGSAVSRSTYSVLFALIGTTYGVGNGTTTFNLPNLAGKIPVGRSTGETEFDTIGETGGAKTHTLTTGEIPAHTHGGLKTYAYPGGSGSVVGANVTTNNYYNTTATDSAGGGGTHNNLQPYLVLNYIIKT